MGSPAWELLFDTLLSDRVELGRRVSQAMQTQLPSYSTMGRETLDDEVGLEVELVLQSARTGRTVVNERELKEELAAIGEERARQGVPVDAMLRAWRIGIDVAVGYAREVGGRLGIDDSYLLEFIQSVLAWSDVAMVTVAAAHRKTELALALHDKDRQSAFVRGVLMGSVPSAQLRTSAATYGLDAGGEFVAFRASVGDDASTIALERTLGLHHAGPRRGLTALVDGAIAGFLTERAPIDIDGVVGFGPPMPMERLAESYRLAVRAFMTARACGLHGAHDLASVGLRAAVVMDADVGESLRQRYLQPLDASGSASELLTTLRTYLASGMHVERTATQLFVHQNTVRYRLARFEELTGANLRVPQDLVEVWWILELAGMQL